MEYLLICVIVLECIIIGISLGLIKRNYRAFKGDIIPQNCKTFTGLRANTTSRVVYIAGNYRSNTANEIHENIEKARKVAVQYWRVGYTVICPHMNSAMMDGVCDDEIFLRGARELLRRSDIVVMLPGWESSEGAKAEYELAKNLNKTIIVCN